MSKKAKEQLPNLVTALRIVFSTVLFFIPLKSTAFFTIYLLCGLSDVADGFLARKLHAESTFGSRLDSFADMFFAAACAVKFIPEADLPPWVWAVAVTAALLKTAEAFAGRAKGKDIAFEHSAANKALGLFIFLLLPFFERAYFCCAAGAAGCFALAVAASELINNINFNKSEQKVEEKTLC